MSPRGQRKPLIGPDDPRHGTKNGYTNLRCRCELCREAVRIAMNEYNHRTGRRKPWEEHLAGLSLAPHGTASRATHDSHPCRCNLCRAADTKARQDYRERHKVPCVNCGQPRLNPKEIGHRDRCSDTGLCLKCYRNRGATSRSTSTGTRGP